jgi:hypothetical protein
VLLLFRSMLRFQCLLTQVVMIVVPDVLDWFDSLGFGVFLAWFPGGFVLGLFLIEVHLWFPVVVI